MGRSILLITIISILFSCGNDRKSPATNGLDHLNKEDSPPSEQIEGKQLLSKLADLADGLWISTSYLENIERSLSIYRSKKYDTRILGFELRKAEILKDSGVLAGFTDHEGGWNYPLRYDDRLNKLVSDMNRGSEFGVFNEPVELSFDGNFCEIYFPKSNTINRFKKVDDLESELRRLLIAGTYKMSPNGPEIRLHANGKVEHFQDYQYYTLAYDFGEGIEYDAVIFFRKPEKGNWSDGTLYQFRLESNTLFLKYVDTNWETLDHQTDGPVIVLEKN